MSIKDGGRYEITDHGERGIQIKADERAFDVHPESVAAGAIRQQARDIAALKDALADEVTANEAFRKAGGARDDEDMPTFCARLIAERDAYKHDALALMRISAGAIQALEQTEKERDQLRTDLAAAVSENAALLAANRDLKAHFDALKGDYDEAAHFARHFIRDDAAITPRGAIIRLGDKCTDLFVRLQQAEARLAAIEAAPTVAWQWMDTGHFRKNKPDGALVFDWRPLIAGPAKD